MTDKKKKNVDRDQFTLEEAEKLLFQIEDIATIERDTGEATRFLLMQVLKALHQAKIINVVSLLEDMSTDNSDAVRHLNYPAQMSLQLLIAMLLQEFRRQENVSPN